MFDEDFEDPEQAETARGPQQQPEIDARRALVSAALKGVDTRLVRRALKGEVPHVVIIETPSQAWSSAIAIEISRAYDNAAASPVNERKKDDNQWVVDMMGEKVRKAQHMVFCTHDLLLLPQLVLTCSDMQLTIPAVDEALLRRAISYMTGRAVRGKISAAAAELDFSVLQLALRTGSSARDCFARLEQASRSVQKQVTGKCTGPKLDDLPLTAEIAAWAYDTVEQLRAVGTGALAPDALQYAMLSGDPGTGKTMLAQAVATTAGWTFHPVTIGDWFAASDGNLGGVSRACKQFFDALLEKDHIVGFIDEIDSLPSRSSLDAKDLQWWGTVINLMLTQIDRLRQSGKSILLLSATNFPSRIDPAMLREGRISNRVEVRAPSTTEEVQAVFAHYFRDDIPLHELTEVAVLTLGATPATIAGWVRSARSVARSERQSVTIQDVIAAVAPADTRSDEEIRAVAIHEAGHAVTAIALGLEVAMVTIIAQGSAGGITRTVNPQSAPNRDELEAMVTALLGGRAADLVLGNKGALAGAAADLKMATALLTQGVRELGLYDRLSHVTIPNDELSNLIEQSMQRLLQRAVDVVTNHRQAVEQLALALLEHRLLRTEQIADVVGLFLAKSCEERLTTPTMGQPLQECGSQEPAESAVHGTLA